MIPRPAKAIILVFPWQEGLPRVNAENDAIKQQDGWSKVDGSVFWMEQTVRIGVFSSICGDS